MAASFFLSICIALLIGAAVAWFVVCQHLALTRLRPGHARRIRVMRRRHELCHRCLGIDRYRRCRPAAAGAAAGSLWGYRAANGWCQPLEGLAQSVISAPPKGGLRPYGYARQNGYCV